MKRNVLLVCVLMTACLALSLHASGQTEGEAGVSTELEKLGFHATGMPIVDQKVTLTIAVMKRPMHKIAFNKMELIKKYEEMTNVHIDWMEIPQSGFNEKKNLMLASGDLPDSFMKNLTDYDVISSGSTGMFIPLNDLIEEYAVNVKKIFAERPEAEVFLTAPDGNIYSLFAINEGPWMAQVGISYYYKPWLDKLGVSVPMTTDEFFDVAMQIKQNDMNGNGDPDDEIPISFLYENGQDGLWPFYYAFGVPETGDRLHIVNGEIMFTATMPEWKEATKYLFKLHSEGLLDIEGFSQKRNQYYAKARSEETKIFYMGCWSKNSVWSGQKYEEYTDFPLLQAPGVDNPVVRRPMLYGWSRGSAPITKNNEYPEVTMRWIDNLYDPIHSMEWIEGPVGVRVIEQADGTFRIADPPEGMSMGEHKHMVTLNGSAFFAMTGDMYNNQLIFEQTFTKVNAIDRYYKPFWTAEGFPRPFYSLEEQKKLQAIDPDILQYVKMMKAKWITEGGIDQEWDGFLATLNEMGLNDSLAVKQAAIDRAK